MHTNYCKYSLFVASLLQLLHIVPEYVIFSYDASLHVSLL